MFSIIYLFSLIFMAIVGTRVFYKYGEYMSDRTKLVYFLLFILPIINTLLIMMGFYECCKKGRNPFSKSTEEDKQEAIDAIYMLNSILG